MTISSLLHKKDILVSILKHLGPGWVLYRLFYKARLLTGAVERQMPAGPWEEFPLSRFLGEPGLSHPPDYHAHRLAGSPPFFFHPREQAAYARLLRSFDRDGCPAVEEASALEKGLITYFGRKVLDLGFPPPWHHNPSTGGDSPRDRHWSRISDFGAGDIKFVWEPNRFAFVYTLVRAYWRTGDERYAELFWAALEDWYWQNPPQIGANWKCGQEISLRIMAWCFGLYGFLKAEASTPERLAMLARMAAVSGERIEANIGYALSQRNNHGMSEALGLWTIGLVFPELRKAPEWRARGGELLEKLGRELIYDDGSFAQHSMVYHRLMLHLYVWALRLGELSGHELSPGLKERVLKAALFLHQVMDDDSGQVPYYGQNDGSLILPLSSCGYNDFRPAVQAVLFLGSRTRCFPEGPWDEDLLWLFGPDSLQAPVSDLPKGDYHAPVGGYTVLRTPESFVFTRCATFRDRPSHADTLHVDLWWKGQNIAIDPGTYSYNCPGVWDNPLARTRYHNTITVDGRDQMDRVGKFLWLPWLRGEVRGAVRSPEGSMAYWEGGHDGYRRLRMPVTHERGIVRIDTDCWLILDRLASREQHAYRLHWLFPDLRHRWDEGLGMLSLTTPGGDYAVRAGVLGAQGRFCLIRADGSSPEGWKAHGYTCREPALSLSLETRGVRVVFWTLLGPSPCEITWDDDKVASLSGGKWRVTLEIEWDTERMILRKADYRGGNEDHLATDAFASSRLGWRRD